MLHQIINPSEFKQVFPSLLLLLSQNSYSCLWLLRMCVERKKFTFGFVKPPELRRSPSYLIITTPRHLGSGDVMLALQSKRQKHQQREGCLLTWEKNKAAVTVYNNSSVDSHALFPSWWGSWCTMNKKGIANCVTLSGQKWRNHFLLHVRNAHLLRPLWAASKRHFSSRDETSLSSAACAITATSTWMHVCFFCLFVLGFDAQDFHFHKLISRECKSVILKICWRA